jgi:hypothetical protein
MSFSAETARPGMQHEKQSYNQNSCSDRPAPLSLTLHHRSYSSFFPQSLPTFETVIVGRHCHKFINVVAILTRRDPRKLAKPRPLCV